MLGRKAILWVAIALLGMGTAPAYAQQMTTIDPNMAIDSDLDTPPPARAPNQADGFPPAPATAPAQQSPAPAYQAPTSTSTTAEAERAAQATNARESARSRIKEADTFEKEELIVAAEGVFGKGAAGLAGILEDILKDQGRPNAYVAGGEGGAAIGIGLRYGRGDLFHKVEGKRPVYWTGPSIGFDVGGDASKVFVLVYNLYDTQDLYKRFPAGEGRAYFVGGFAASYLRRGDVVLIPIRLGVGWRLGVNAGYMKFTEKRRVIPF